MDINTCFPSKYIKAADLQGQEITVSIAGVAMEDVGEEGSEKLLPVVYFTGHTKGLVLNKTNAGTIAGMYGSDTDRWASQPITLYPTQTDFKGQSTPCIRVKVQPPTSVQTPVVTQPQAVPPVVSTPQPTGPTF